MMDKDFIVRRVRRKGRFAWIIFVLFTLCVVLLPPVCLAGPVQALTGWPVFWGGLLVSAVWVVVVYGLVALLMAVWRRHVLRRHGGASARSRNMFDDVLEALDSLAQGDYDVVVEGNERFHYNELADRINTLARQLSSMEQMRQDFVSNVSHEIRSPLTSIAGFAQLLKKEELTRQERLHYIEVIQSEVERMQKLSDHLLRLSMLDGDASLDCKVFRLDKQVESVLLAQEPQWAGKQLELDIDLAEAACAGDEELLLQVWQNLLQNAIKFTPAGGHIAVALRRQDDALNFTVRDDGIGIPSDDLVHIFERFYKVDKARDRSMGGNGLGLPLARRIVELHGGQVKVESTPGAGSTFTVVLPCAAEG